MAGGSSRRRQAMGAMADQLRWPVQGQNQFFRVQTMSTRDQRNDDAGSGDDGIY